MGIGSAFGIAGALAGSRVMAYMNNAAGKVTSTNTEDPKVVLGSTALLAILALAACYLPARRSTRIDPSITPRQE